MADEMLTVVEAADRLGSTVKWVYKLLAQDRLKYKKFGSIYQISANSVKRFQPGPIGRPPVKKTQKSRKPQERLSKTRARAA